MRELLKLSRETLRAHFAGKQLNVPAGVKKKYARKQACFVTLTEYGGLRGCIGSLYPKQALYKQVIESTINAALADPRFLPLQKYELDDIKIEISVLSVLRKLKFKSPEDLLEQIDNKHGVMIQKSGYSATYLPQVWHKIPDKEGFLGSLCQKAGMFPAAWREKGLDVWTYTVKSIEEE